MEITSNNIDQYVDNLDKNRKDDIVYLINLFEELSNYKPQLWGSIVGFGNLHYKYASKREGNMPLIGLANRKAAITLYLSYTISEYEYLEKLGKYKVSKSCLYIKKLSDIDINVLKKIIVKSMEETLSYDMITVNK